MPSSSAGSPDQTRGGSLLNLQDLQLLNILNMKPFQTNHERNHELLVYEK